MNQFRNLPYEAIEEPTVPPSLIAESSTAVIVWSAGTLALVAGMTVLWLLR